MAIIRANFGFYHAMTAGFSASGGTISTLSSQNRIEIYSGTMPDDADDWQGPGAGSPSPLLATFTD